LVNIREEGMMEIPPHPLARLPASALGRVLPMVVYFQGLLAIVEEIQSVERLREDNRHREADLRAEIDRLAIRLEAFKRHIRARVKLEELRAAEFVAVMAALPHVRDPAAARQALDIAREILRLGPSQAIQHPGRI
jgi:hypothetical protein